METKPLQIPDYPSFDGFYTIREDGQIFSLRKNRPIRLSTNSCGYYHTWLTGSTPLPNGSKGRWFAIAPLVNHHFNGPKPSEKHETHHKDHDRSNNYYSNLKWLTHSENLIRSYRETDRKKGGPPIGTKRSEKTRKLMAEAKNKPVCAVSDDEDLLFDSIKDLLEHFGMYRKKYDRIMKADQQYMGYTFELVYTS